MQGIGRSGVARRGQFRRYADAGPRTIYEGVRKGWGDGTGPQQKVGSGTQGLLRLCAVRLQTEVFRRDQTLGLMKVQVSGPNTRQKDQTGDDGRGIRIEELFCSMG